MKNKWILKRDSTKKRGKGTYVVRLKSETAAVCALFVRVFRYGLLCSLCLKSLVSVREKVRDFSYPTGLFRKLSIPLFVTFCSLPSVASEVVDVWKSNRAVDQLNQKKFLEAHENFSQLLGEWTFHPVFQFNLGSSFIGLGETQKAIKMYKELLKLNPLPIEIEFSLLYNLGVLYTQRLDDDPVNLDRALHFYQEALKLRPDSREIKTNIEILFRGSGGQGSKKKDQRGKKQNRNENPEDQQKNFFTNKRDEKKDQKKYKSEKMSKKDVEKILHELKKQEQKIRAKHERKKFREADRDKNW